MERMATRARHARAHLPLPTPLPPSRAPVPSAFGLSSSVLPPRAGKTGGGVSAGRQRLVDAWTPIDLCGCASLARACFFFFVSSGASCAPLLTTRSDLTTVVADPMGSTPIARRSSRCVHLSAAMWDANGVFARAGARFFLRFRAGAATLCGGGLARMRASHRFGQKATSAPNAARPPQPRPTSLKVSKVAARFETSHNCSATFEPCAPGKRAPLLTADPSSLLFAWPTAALGEAIHALSLSLHSTLSFARDARDSPVP